MRGFGTKDACQAFTAVGVVRDERVYQGTMGDDFNPFRKDVDWFAAREAPLRPLLESLSFTQGKSNWGYAFRFGLLKVTEADMDRLARALHAVPAVYAVHAVHAMHAVHAAVAAELHAAG